MDRRTKKKLDLAQQNLQALRQRLAGAKRQPDEAGEVERLSGQIAALEAEVRALKDARGGK